MKKNEKTNVMRLLDRSRIPYQSYYYESTGALSGTEVARVLGQNPQQVFKTLVTAGKSGQHYVFVIPVERELDLKKAAEAVGEKSIAMIKEKELLPLTGYVHGGCSPIGMKKQLAKAIDASSRQQDTIMFSAGKIGCQVETALADLSRMLPFQTADVTG